MTTKQSLQLFEQKKVRTIWDEEQEKWYFAIVDVVAVLTEQDDYLKSRKYWNKLKQRLKEEGNETVTNCHQFKLQAADGKMRLTDVADTEQLFRFWRRYRLNKTKQLFCISHIRKSHLAVSCLQFESVTICHGLVTFFF